MGIDISECHTVGKLIGIKTVANEFIAYRELGLLIEANKLSKRAQSIATYALCGYANPGSIGVQLATIGKVIHPKYCKHIYVHTFIFWLPLKEANFLVLV